jgi:hypothetical protein
MQCKKVKRNKMQGKKGMEERERKKINYERHTTEGEKEEKK